ncbi:MAG: lysophospholipid acyltransferase family protein [Candidatus Omnitrophota bacterium]
MKIKYRRYYIYYLLKILFFFISLISLKVSLVIADFLGKIAFLVIRKYREIAISNLDTALSSDHESNVRIARNVFANFAKNGAEWIKLSTLDPKKIGDLVTEDQGLEYLDDALSGGNGAVILGFHFGNWELLGLYLRYKGYPGALVAKRLYFYKYDKFIARLRQRYDARIVYRDESPKKMLKILRSGEVLGIVPDQDVDSIDGVFVDFFGRSAYTPTAPVKIAMAARTKIVPAFVIRKKDNTHKLVLEKPIDIPGGKISEEDVKRCTQAWTNVLEKYVREYPEQWVWVHRRWKTQK